MTARTRVDFARLSDLELAALCAARDREAIRQVTIANNQRLFRAAWSILKHRQDAEEAVQAGYLKAFAAIGDFAGRSSLSTWLTRIVINEALARLRVARRRQAHLESEGVMILDRYRESLSNGSAPFAPDAALAREQLRLLLEQAIAGLPDIFRTVFVLRQVEGLSVEETAEALGLATATVKTRLMRARRKLQDALAPEVRSALTGTFPFAGADCVAMTDRVLAALSG
jgi:RNA polymerase sigma-70 factor (ECF subfamily)